MSNPHPYNLKDGPQPQVIISLSITDYPKEVSLSASDSIDPIQINITARQIWSAQPSRPLTVSTFCNILDVEKEDVLYTSNSLFQHVALRSAMDPSKYLQNLGPMERRGLRPHYVHPDYRQDWKEQIGFATIPSLSSGQSYTVTKILERSSLEPAYGPKPMSGETWMLSLEDKFPIYWWNWGDLEGDLKHRNFSSPPHPRLSGKKVEDCIGEWPEPWLMSFGGWDTEDWKGKGVVSLKVEVDKSEWEVTFVD